MSNLSVQFEPIYSFDVLDHTLRSIVNFIKYVKYLMLVSYNCIQTSSLHFYSEPWTPRSGMVSFVCLLANHCELSFTHFLVEN